MYFRNNVNKGSIFVLLVLIMSLNLKAMREPENDPVRVTHIDTAIAGDVIHNPLVLTPSMTMNNYSLNDDFSYGDRNAGFFKKVKNALNRGFFYGISNIGATLVTFAVQGVGYLVLSKAISQKKNESSVALEELLNQINSEKDSITANQLVTEAQLINSYVQQNNDLSSSNDKKYQEFQENLKIMKKSYSDHLIEYFKQNQEQKDTESKNNTTSLPTGIPTPAA